MVEGLLNKEIIQKTIPQSAKLTAPFTQGRLKWGTTCGGRIGVERKHNKYLKPLSRELRKNMTKEEKHLWYDFLNTHMVRFTRQKILGRYIADFYSAKANLVIELDGSQHGEEKNIIKDEERTEYLEQFGIMVLRIPNYEVNKNFNGVCTYIDKIVRERLSG